MVEAAGIEPASGEAVPETSTCLSPVFLLPSHSQGQDCDGGLPACLSPCTRRQDAGVSPSHDALFQNRGEWFWKDVAAQIRQPVRSLRWQLFFAAGFTSVQQLGMQSLAQFSTVETRSPPHYYNTLQNLKSQGYTPKIQIKHDFCDKTY